VVASSTSVRRAALWACGTRPYIAQQGRLEDDDQDPRARMGEGCNRGQRRRAIFIYAPGTAPILDEPQMRAAVSGKIPFGQFALTNDVAGAIIYFASDTGRMVTETILAVDGGGLRNDGNSASHGWGLRRDL
jgi:hypothetical protein